MSLRIDGDCEVLCARRICYEEMLLEKPSTTIEKCVKICRSINKKK